jgi:hypothetical protein
MNTVSTDFSPRIKEGAWDRFQACAAAFGAERKLWPFSDRVVYDQFAQTVAGQQILVSADDLDALLDVSDSVGASSDFMARLGTMPLPQQVKAPSLFVVMWRRGIALVLLMAALGFGNGYIEQTTGDQVWQSATMTTAFGVTIQ